MEIGNLKPSLTTEEQQRLYHQWKETSNEHFKVKITISYVSLISKLISDFKLDNPSDILSEMMVIVWNALEKYDVNRASIYTYLYRIIYTRLIDKYRQQSRYNRIYITVENLEIQSRIDDMFQVPDMIEDICQEEEFAIVTKGLKKLNVKERTIIKHRYFEKLSISRICSIMQLKRIDYDILLEKAIKHLGNKVKLDMEE
jgi:RNA polymerase sigma factor (sigma-70 family)